jgi:hypothetical protein
LLGAAADRRIKLTLPVKIKVPTRVAIIAADAGKNAE